MRCLTCRKWKPCLSRNRFRDVLASFHGMTLNAAAVGRRLDVSQTTAMSWIKAYEKAGLVHLLPPIGTSRRPLFLFSKRFNEDGAKYPEASVLEAVRRLLPATRFHHWKAGRVRRIPLIADTGTERIGFAFSTTPSPRRKEWLPLLIALRRGLINRAFLVQDGRATLKEQAVVILPLPALLADLPGWILDDRTWWEKWKALGRINRERCERRARVSPAAPAWPASSP